MLFIYLYSVYFTTFWIPLFRCLDRSSCIISVNLVITRQNVNPGRFFYTSKTQNRNDYLTVRLVRLARSTVIKKLSIKLMDVLQTDKMICLFIVHSEPLLICQKYSFSVIFNNLLNKNVSIIIINVFLGVGQLHFSLNH